MTTRKTDENWRKFLTLSREIPAAVLESERSAGEGT
jgi:hypothetical protein